MFFYSAEIGKKCYLLSAESISKANEILQFYYKDKTIIIQEITLPDPLLFRLNNSSVFTVLKIKGSFLSFLSENKLYGKIDISVLPVELCRSTT